MAEDKSSAKPAARDDSRAAARQRVAALARANAAGGGGNMVQFFTDTWNELKKTTWPDLPTLRTSTLIVLSFIVAVAVWVGVLYLVMTRVAQAAGFFGQ